jgi:hypothetical protein
MEPRGSRTMFQSSPGPKTGCNRELRPATEEEKAQVSILTRPEDRVQRRGSSRPHRKFYSFNPHPARRPGATHWYVKWRVERSLLFQSSPGPKTGCNTVQYIVEENWLLVSILTRPEDRVQRARVLQTSFRLVLFQSSPGPKTGCNANSRRARLVVNSVSILTRPEDRVQPAGRYIPGFPFVGFNPHPARRPGATRATVRRPCRPLWSFNPHPARRPGATLRPRITERGRRLQVSILTRPEDRVQRSTPSQKSGRPTQYTTESAISRDNTRGTFPRTPTVNRQHFRFAPHYPPASLPHNTPHIICHRGQTTANTPQKTFRWQNLPDADIDKQNTNSRLLKYRAETHTKRDPNATQTQR